MVPRFYTNCSKNSFIISANTYEKYIASKEYCIARRDGKMCFLRKCRFHIILIGDLKEFLPKLDAFCLNYQLVECVYTLFNFRFGCKIMSGVDKSLIMCSGQFISNNTKEWTECPSLRKRDPLRKKNNNHLFSSLQKTKSTQAIGSVFADRLEQVKKAKFKLELIKIVDSSVDGHYLYTSDLVSFKIRSF